MSKSEISSSYMDEQKRAHLQNPNVPNFRNVLILGCAPGNIGEAIAEQLRTLPDFSVTALTKEQRRAEDIETLPFLNSYDTVIFCNGENWMDWTENYPQDKVHDVVYNSMIASMVGANAFARATMWQPYKKNIVFIGSGAYKGVLNGSSAYCAAKAGLAHFAKCIAWELAPKNFDVFTVHPSNTEHAPMSEDTIVGLMRYRHLSREQAEAYWGAILPRNRWLQKYDIANVIQDLISGRWTYASGTNIDLGGGQR